VVTNDFSKPRKTLPVVSGFSRRAAPAYLNRKASKAIGIQKIQQNQSLGKSPRFVAEPIGERGFKRQGVCCMINQLSKQRDMTNEQ
jgi:hypothetical protein